MKTNTKLQLKEKHIEKINWNRIEKEKINWIWRRAILLSWIINIKKLQYDNMPSKAMERKSKNFKSASLKIIIAKDLDQF